MNKFGLNKEDFESPEAYKKEYNRLYGQSDKGKEAKRRYGKSDVGKLAHQKYSKSEKGKLAEKKAKHKWNLSEKGKLVHQKYRQENKGLCNARVSKIRAGKACPPWADLDAITEIYKNCPVGKEVDHDHALNGKNFSGLHIPENLQYLTPSENRSKCHKHV